MQLSIRTLENQAVLIVHPGTSIQQPITAKTAKKSHLLKLSFEGESTSSQTKETVAK